jgi:hypothetical protein
VDEEGAVLVWAGDPASVVVHAAAPVQARAPLTYPPHTSSKRSSPPVLPCAARSGPCASSNGSVSPCKTLQPLLRPLATNTGWGGSLPICLCSVRWPVNWIRRAHLASGP